MTWKPTDEMKKAHTDAFWATQRDNLTEIALFSALIAVQPLIAAEAMERAAQIADAFVASADEGPLDRVDTFQNMAAESIAKAIRFASTGNTTAPLTAELEASMAEIARLRGDLVGAEAKALERAAEFVDGIADLSPISNDISCFQNAAKAIRSLIPKPVEAA